MSYLLICWYFGLSTRPNIYKCYFGSNNILKHVEVFFGFGETILARYDEANFSFLVNNWTFWSFEFHFVISHLSSFILLSHTDWVSFRYHVPSIKLIAYLCKLSSPLCSEVSYLRIIIHTWNELSIQIGIWDLQGIWCPNL